MTFDELFAEHNLTREERSALVWHLASIRTKELVEALLAEPHVDTSMLRGQLGEHA